MNKNDKIYVAGHQGLVGSAVMRQLIQSGYANLLTSSYPTVDLRCQQAVEDFFERERPAYVVLAAAKVGGILANSTYKAEFIYDNLMIAANVIHASYKFKIKRLINLGSSCIYPKNAPQPLKEEYLLTGLLEETNEPYAIAKIAAIKLCRYYNEQYGTNFISLMPTNLYGPNDNFNLETSHVLPALLRKFYLAKLLASQDYKKIFEDIKAAPLGWDLDRKIKSISDVKAVLEGIGISGDRVVLWGNGQVYREFMHVDDLAYAIKFILEKEDVALKEDALLNVGTGSDLAIYSLAHLIKELVGFQGSIQFDETSLVGTYRKLLDISRIAELGWRPQIALLEGISNVFSSYKESRENMHHPVLRVFEKVESSL